MDLIQYAALGTCTIAFLAVGGVVLRLMTRLTTAETTATEAKETANELADDVTRLSAELVNHRVDVAKDYVSKETLQSLEIRIVDAINRLGDRIDNLFNHGRSPK